MSSTLNRRPFQGMISYAYYNPTSHHRAVKQLGEETFNPTYKDYFNEALDEADPQSIVVLNGEQVVGAAILAQKLLFRYLNATEIAYLMVKRGFQGQGIGSSLLNKIKAMNDAIVLEVSYDNPDAERLYRKHGFQTWRWLRGKKDGSYILGWSREREERVANLRPPTKPSDD